MIGILVFYGFIALLCSFRLVMGWNGFPILDGDATCFMPNTVSFAGGHGLINAFWPRAADIDTLHQGRLVWHGFLMPMIIGGLMWRPTPFCMHQVMALVDVATILIFFWKCRRLIAGGERWMHVLCAGAAVLVVANAQILVAGRPETMCMLWVSSAWAAIGACPGRLHLPIVGIGLGCVACTDPAVAIIAAMAIAVESFRRWRWRHALKSQCVIMGACVATIMLLATAIYPYGMVTWIAGLREHSRLLATENWSGRLSFSGIAAAWISWPNMPLLAFLTLNAGLAWHSLGTPGVGRTRIDRFFLGGAVGLLLLVMYAFIFSRPQQLYYLLAMIPILAALNVQRVAPAPAISGHHPPLPAEPRLMAYGTFGAIALPAMGFLFTVLAFSDYCHFGVSLEEARDRYAKMIGNQRGVAATRSLWVLSDVPAGVRYCDPRDELTGLDLTLDDRIFLFQQANFGQLRPRHIPGYDCIYDDFSDHVPKLWRFHYGNAVKSYAFAIYARHDPTGIDSVK